MHGGVDFTKGQFRMLGAVYDKDMAALQVELLKLLLNL